MYKPRYCSECGQRIERERWRLWHSGQFCDQCAGKFKFARAATVALIFAVGLLVGFIIGVLSEAPKHNPSPALQIERLPTPAKAVSTGVDSSQTSINQRVDKQAPICGAPTKSGKP